MRLLVNHLTRMAAGYFCVAGLDVANGKHVRPVLLGRLPQSLLRVHGGAFDMADVVDLGQVQPRPQRPELQMFGSRGACGVNQGKGRASLGVLRPSEQPALELRTGFSGGKEIRIKISDGVLNPFISLTDIRFYENDHVTPNKKAIERAQQRLEAGEGVLLSVGLTRAYPTAHYGTIHSLQVNNIHFAKKPDWRLSAS